MASVVSVAIDSIAAGGDGVGRQNGLVVFVPRTAPGDVVTARIAGKGRFARGALASIVTTSPSRVEPPCEHYTRDRCGGCQIQHLSYDAQLLAKRRIVSDAIQRIAKRDVSSLESVEPSPNEWRYRTKLTLAMRRSGTGWIAGLHRFDDPSQVFALADCPITDRRVVAAWREIVAAGSLLPEGPQLRGSVRVADAGATFLLYGGLRWNDAERFLEAVPSIRALWWEPDIGARRLVEDHRSDRSPAASFGQVNPAVAALLQKYLIERISAHSPATVIDAYAGLGDTSAELSASGIEVAAIEVDLDASEWSARRLAPPSRAVHGRVEDLIGAALPADVVVLNPPRAGVDSRVAEQLEQHRSTLKAVLYVSCDPATLARDLTRLTGFRIASLKPFDMFPQTAHVETVCELVPA